MHALLVLAFCLVSFTSEAAKKKQPPEPDLSMQFAVVRGSSPLCEPNCPEWIWAEGEIRASTASRFKKFLKTVGERKLPVIIQSPGGDLDAAFAMGRMIRARGLDAAVGYTTFTSCAPRQKDCAAAKTGGYTGIAAAGFAYCNSACPMMLAGGTRRLVGSWAHLGVHQITTTMVKQEVLYKTTTRVVKGKKVVKKKIVKRKDAGSYTTTKMGKRLHRKIETYLTEMGVSTDLIEPIRKTAAADILKLDQVEMLNMRLITSLDAVDMLTGPTVCKAQPAPANCRAVATAENKAAEPAVAKAVEPGIAKPDRVGEIRFVVVRGSSPLCDPNCPEWISAEGTITGRTPEKLRQLFKTIGDRRLPVVISSPGGDLLGAMALGRLIRERRLDVAVAKTHFIRCAPDKEGCVAEDGVYLGVAIDEWGKCSSACPLVLAAGVRRLVGPQASLTVHSMALERLVRAYLDEMALGPGLLGPMQVARYARHLKLEPDAMARVKLTTGPESADALTAPTVCEASPKPANCRVVAATQ